MALTRIPNHLDLPGEVGSGVTFVTSSLDLSSGSSYDVTLADLRQFDFDTNDDGRHLLGETITLDDGAISTTLDGNVQVVTANLTLDDGSVISWANNIRVMPLANGEYLWYVVSVPPEYEDAIIESIEIVSSYEGNAQLGTYSPSSIDLRNGIVDGTDNADQIDENYSGDPGGDYVDNDDNTAAGVDAGGAAGSDDDLIEAYGGNDVVFSRDGNDTVYGGTGNDTIEGGAGSDSLSGGDGADLLRGDFAAGNWTLPGAGADTLDGGAGNDTLFGGNGDDELFGGTEHDVLQGELGNDLVDGGAGDDYLMGDSSNSSNTGGNDTIYGRDGFDAIDGGAGDDLIDGGVGNDTVWGDFGLYDNENNGADTIHGGGGNDLLHGNFGDDSITGDDGDDTLYGNGGITRRAEFLASLITIFWTAAPGMTRSTVALEMIRYPAGQGWIRSGADLVTTRSRVATMTTRFPETTDLPLGLVATTP